MGKRIFLDHASTTPVLGEVLGAMKKFWSSEYGNPGSIHSFGINASKAIEESRKNIAMVLGAKSSEIIFTSGGTESNNLAILGVANLFKKNSNGAKLHIITTQIEHHAVLYPFKYLENSGFEVTYLPVSEKGIVSVEEVKKAIKENTVLISIIYANNEVGTIQPIREIGNLIKKVRADRPYPVFHTDACQAPCFLNLQVSNLGVDLMTISGSKLYGPKGSGFLYVKNNTPIEPTTFGGGQESGLRSGTQAVPLIVGLAKALKIAEDKKKKESDRLISLRDYFIRLVLKKIAGTKLNGDMKLRLPNNANIYFPGISGEQLVIELDVKGIAVSTGSACSSREEAPSHVLLAIYNDKKRADGSIRFTFGRDTTKKDVDQTIKTLDSIIKRIR
ncbi:TPA: cysteine desulfurase NifS [Patescibacteria group bacterium]|nr:cysteine desulfurase NifS [Patescibacteria group bacterium]